jgi:hypothetical protein
MVRVAVAALIGIVVVPLTPAAIDGSSVQKRMDADARAGKPLVAHVVVALCDNEYQGIVPVPKQLGDGDRPGTNLYWGALYGVRTHFTREAGWELVGTLTSLSDSILERVILTRTLERAGMPQQVYVVADAWRGREIEAAIGAFLEMSAGGGAERIRIDVEGDSETLEAGGTAHIVAYVGHNGLMDFSVKDPVGSDETAGPRSAIVLACASRPYFESRLGGSHPLLLTAGLMAPEAYTLDAAIRSWFAGERPAAVREAAADAYDRYQRCGIAAARKLFTGRP